MVGFRSQGRLLVALAVLGLLAAGCAGRSGEGATTVARDRPDQPRAAALGRFCDAARDKGDLALAAAACQRAHELDRADPAVELRLAVALHELGDFDGAIRAYRGVLAATPASVDARFGLGLAYLATGRYRSANAELVAALGADPENYRIHNALGVVRDQLGDQQTAQAHYRFGLALAPENAALRANLARSLDLAEARIHLATDGPGGGKQFARATRGPQAPPDLTTKVQQSLADLGYDAGDVDGIVGHQTVAAVRAFQADSGLQVDGQITELLLYRLEAALGQSRSGASIPNGLGLLWKIEGGGAEPSYLFGTVHLSDPRVLDLDASVSRALATADTVALEVVGGKRLAARALRSMQLPADQDLEEILGQPLFADTVAALARIGVPATAARRFKPWAIYALLNLSTAELKRAAAGVPVLDRWLEEEAARQGKRVRGLESIDEHLAVLDDMAEVVQIAVLESAVAYANHTDQLQEELTRFYLARDLAAIQRFMIEPALRSEPDMTRVFLERLIVARNRTWLARIKRLLAAGNAFIAVGALHLPGETGLLRLLQAAGFRVSRVY